MNVLNGGSDTRMKGERVHVCRICAFKTIFDPCWEPHKVVVSI